MAWQQAYETLTDQRQRIEAARSALTEAWPATPGSAAGSFFDQVDALTQAMGATAETAVSAHGALTGIVTAVDGATAKVDTLHQSWQQNQATIGDAVPTADWTQPLNDQAHMVMGQTDAAIAEHATQLSPPIPYSPPTFREPLTVISDSSKGLSSSNPAPIAATGRLQGSPSSLAPVLTADGSGMTTTRDVAADRASPIQGGGGSASAISAEAAISTELGTRPVGRASGATGSTNEPQVVRDGNSSGRIASADQSATNSGVRVVSREGNATQTGHLRSGVNDKSSTEFVDPVGQRESTAPGRLNSRSTGVGPIDGSVGAPSDVSTVNASTRMAAADSVGYGGLLGGGLPMQNAGASSGGRRARGEMSNWALPVGVPAVIEPGDEVQIHHDPGPGVIGIDR
jgi:hypothetical protein